MKKAVLFFCLLLKCFGLQAQDTLLLLREESLDRNKKPIRTWIYEYDDNGKEIAFLQIDHLRPDTVFHRREYDSSGRLENHIVYSTRNPRKDTANYIYHGDTTIYISGEPGYHSVTKTNKQKQVFYESHTYYSEYGTIDEHTIDSIFYDPVNRKEYTKTYLMSEAQFAYDLSPSVAATQNKNKRIIHAGDVQKEKWVYRNKDSQIIKEVETNYANGITSTRDVTYDNQGRFIKSDLYYDNETKHWITEESYEVINDSIHEKVWNNSSDGYKVYIRPLNSNQQQAAISSYYNQKNELISSHYNLFNAEGYIVESTTNWYEDAKPVNATDFQTAETTHYTYVSFPIRLKK